MSVAPDRYIGLGSRWSANSRFRNNRDIRKHWALVRAKLYHRLYDEPRSTTHANHCCRLKPRDRLLRVKRWNLAQHRAEMHLWIGLPF